MTSGPMPSAGMAAIVYSFMHTNSKSCRVLGFGIWDLDLGILDLPWLNVLDSGSVALGDHDEPNSHAWRSGRRLDCHRHRDQRGGGLGLRDPAAPVNHRRRARAHAHG